MAGFISGISLLSITYFTTYSLAGARPKYHALFFGLLSIYFVLTQKSYFLAGLFGGVTGWFYAPTIVFLIFGILIILKENPRKLFMFLIGAAIISIAAVIPLLIWQIDYPDFNVLDSMILESIIAPSKIVESFTTSHRITLLKLFLKTNLITLFIGAIGVLFITIKNFRKYWWPTLGVITSLYFLSVDFDGPPDLFHLLIFISLITGLLYKESPNWIRSLILASMMALLFISATWIGGVEGYIESSIFRAAAFRRFPPPKNRAPNMQTQFWYGVIPENCHYRMSVAELTWIEYNNLDANSVICGVSEFLNIETLGDMINLSSTDQ